MYSLMPVLIHSLKSSPLSGSTGARTTSLSSLSLLCGAHRGAPWTLRKEEWLPWGSCSRSLSRPGFPSFTESLWCSHPIIMWLGWSLWAKGDRGKKWWINNFNRLLGTHPTCSLVREADPASEDAVLRSQSPTDRKKSPGHWPWRGGPGW